MRIDKPLFLINFLPIILKETDSIRIEYSKWFPFGFHYLGAIIRPNNPLAPDSGKLERIKKPCSLFALCLESCSRRWKSAILCDTTGMPCVSNEATGSISNSADSSLTLGLPFINLAANATKMVRGSATKSQKVSLIFQLKLQKIAFELKPLVPCYAGIKFVTALH